MTKSGVIQSFPSASRKLAPAIGAEVLGVDLSQPMDDALSRKIERRGQGRAAGLAGLEAALGGVPLVR